MNKMNKSVISIAITSAMLGSSGVGYAQVVQNLDKPGLYASVRAAVVDDDNILRQDEKTTALKSDTITIVAPDVAYAVFMGKHRLLAQYVGNYGSYSDYSNEDYTDHSLNAELFLDLDPKFNIDLLAGQTQGHESRGASGTGTVSTKPNEFDDTFAFAQLTYGRRIAKAQVQLDVETRELDFTNNNQDARDRDIATVSGRVFYNLGPKTSAFLELTQKDIDYVQASSTLDSTEQYVHIGARWEATAKTTGELKFGTYDKDFDSASRTDTDGTSLVANITWSPRTYSHLTLTALNRPNETATGDDSYTASYYTLAWQHGINDKLGLNANVRTGTDDYEGGTRKDDLLNYGVGVSYDFKRWLSVGLNYDYSERDSNVAGSDFEANVYTLSASLSLPE